MKAIMSDRVRKILADPEEREELLKGLNDLHNSKAGQSSFRIGKSDYKLKSLNAWKEKGKS